MIAASAVQLTFGLENFKLDYFDRIIIYPEPYYSQVTGYYHKGETNQKGIIVLSWKDFLKGYEISDDTFNVGLHEMAHALDLENRIVGVDKYFKTHFEKWKKIATPAYVKVRDEQDSIFRNYGGTNFTEFFAVSVEHFFERSEEFRDSLPDVYESLSKLLNQDPLRAGSSSTV
jgi:MtfA peptidase